MFRGTFDQGLLAAAAGTGLVVLLATVAPAQGREAGSPAGPREGRPAAMDANGDGVVARAEMEAVVAARAAEMDLNKDGRITADELLAASRTREARTATRRLARMDRDGDGAVSVQEFKQAQLARFAKLDGNGDGVIDQAEREARREHRPGGHPRSQ